MQTKIQTTYQTILEKVEYLYLKYVPDTIRLRRNIDQQKQPGTVIIATTIWGMVLGFPTQISTYHAVCTFLYPDDFPSHSRYNRLSANLKEALKIIRYEYVKSLDNQSRYAVIDSFPCPLCATIRNRRAKLFSEFANIGYNATKELYYYGFKISLSVDSKGFPIAYEGTSASIHDVNMAYDLVEQAPNKQILADKGYISENLKQACNVIGVDLWTPPKKNQKSNEKVDSSLLCKFRKKVKTVISNLSSFGIQQFKSRSLAGFEARLEAILLTYSFMLEKAQTIIC
nr:IS982 family transposase [Enterococcus durans]